MKNIFILIFALCVGCSKNDTKFPAPMDTTTDYSASLVSEEDLAKNGCFFKATEYSTDLKCHTYSSTREVYNQRLSILKYTNDARRTIIAVDPNLIVPTSNVATMTSLGSKSRLAFEQTKDLFSFVDLGSYEFWEKSPKNYAYVRTLEFLLHVASTTNCMFELESNRLDCGRGTLLDKSTISAMVGRFKVEMSTFIDGKETANGAFVRKVLSALKRDWNLQ